MWYGAFAGWPYPSAPMIKHPSIRPHKEAPGREVLLWPQHVQPVSFSPWKADTHPVRGSLAIAEDVSSLKVGCMPCSHPAAACAD